MDFYNVLSFVNVWVDKMLGNGKNNMILRHELTLSLTSVDTSKQRLVNALCTHTHNFIPRSQSIIHISSHTFLSIDLKLKPQIVMKNLGYSNDLSYHCKIELKNRVGKVYENRINIYLQRWIRETVMESKH